MFEQNVVAMRTVFCLDDHVCGGAFAYKEVSSRKVPGGILVRGPFGNGFKIKTAKAETGKYLLLFCYQDVFGVRTDYSDIIRDPVLVKRLIRYTQEYYVKNCTNCATFAEYLRTGQFSECNNEKMSFMVSGGMNSYSGEKICPGDTLYVLYVTKQAKGSRRIPSRLRNFFRKEGESASRDLRKLKGKGDHHFSSEEFIGQYRLGGFADYHCMTCIGIHSSGEPIFISQMGRNDPRKGDTPEITPIVVSIGMVDTYDKYIPAALFIKRGRK